MSGNPPPDDTDGPAPQGPPPQRQPPESPPQQQVPPPGVPPGYPPPPPPGYPPPGYPPPPAGVPPGYAPGDYRAYPPPGYPPPPPAGVPPGYAPGDYRAYPPPGYPTRQPPGYPPPGYPPPGYPTSQPPGYPPPGYPPPGYPPPGYPPPGGYGGPLAPGYPPGPQAQGVYASWGVRVGAYVIDAIIVWVLCAVVDVPINAAKVAMVTFRTGTGTSLAREDTVSALALVAVFALSVLYGTLFCGSRRAQTPGMMAIGIRVVRADNGSPIGYGRALARTLLQWVFFGALAVGWLIDMAFPLWDPRRQTLHDKITGSVVVRR